MKGSPTRIAAVTLGLLLAGAFFGAVAAATGVTIASLLYDRVLPPVEVIMGTMILGAVLGAPLLPAAGLLLMRRVPLGLSFLGTTAGAVTGGVLGMLVTVQAVGSLGAIAPLAGAVLGFFAAVLLLRRRFRAPGVDTRVPIV